MTLGRTSSGAIKIKTDEAGGGLRAVECACCGGCGCDFQITDPLLTVLRNATTGTCNGDPPIIFEKSGTSFFSWYFVGDDFLSYFLSFQDPCLFIGAYDVNEIRAVSSPDCCIPILNPGADPSIYYCAPTAPFTVNGVDFPTVNLIFGDYPSPPPGNFIVS